MTALLSGAVALAAACGSSGTTSSHELTLRLRGAQAAAEHGGRGDFGRWTYSAALTDGSGAATGRADSFCSSTADPTLDLCTVTLRLRRGTVAAQGLIGHVGGRGVLSVDGGTGAYSDVRGSIETIELNGSGEQLVLHLVTEPA